MDIEALIENLEALDDSLKTTTIRESENLDDFRDCVKRFQASLAGLIGVAKSSNSNNHENLKPLLEELQLILSELDNLGAHEIKVLDFLNDLAPRK
tara:strand:- start:127 stop:414 length:288 start_codon:yes stop_codon:yes gene_type:complete